MVKQTVGLSPAEILRRVETVDGVGSGLDADLWQGHTYVAPDAPAQLLTKIETVDGTGSGLDADLLDGNHYVAPVVYAVDRWGISARQVAPVHLAGVAPTDTYGLAYDFGPLTSECVATGVFAPQNLIAPAASSANAKISVVWADSGVIAPGQKVGWLACMKMVLEGDPFFEATIGPLNAKSKGGVANADAVHVDWKANVAGAPADTTDPYRAYPYEQWAIGYTTVVADALSSGRTNVTQLRRLKWSGAAIVPDPNYSFTNLCQTYGGKKAYGALYIWRLQSFPATAALGDTKYDGDGDTFVDTDNYAQHALFFGLDGQFL